MCNAVGAAQRELHELANLIVLWHYVGIAHEHGLCYRIAKELKRRCSAVRSHANQIVGVILGSLDVNKVSHCAVEALFLEREHCNASG